MDDSDEEEKEEEFRKLLQERTIGWRKELFEKNYEGSGNQVKRRED